MIGSDETNFPLLKLLLIERTNNKSLLSFAFNLQSIQNYQMYK